MFTLIAEFNYQTSNLFMPSMLYLVSVKQDVPATANIGVNAKRGPENKGPKFTKKQKSKLQLL
jgi:hypothetical protein